MNNTFKKVKYNYKAQAVQIQSKGLTPMTMTL